LDIWDYLVAAGIGLLIFFTPFASGGVSVSATGMAEGICFALAILWSGKLFSSVLRRGGLSSRGWNELRVLALAAGAFLGLLILQLVPLPPVVIRAVSPHAYDLYRNSLPGWPNSGIYAADPSYVRPPPHQNAPAVVAVLPTTEEVKNGAAVPFAKRTGPEPAQVDAKPVPSSAWRSLSVTPVLTRAGLLKCAAMASLFLLVVLYQPGAGDARAERQFRRVVVLLILASGVAVAIGGLSQQAVSHGRILMGSGAVGSGSATARTSGPFVNPDHFANYLAMIVPLAVAGALFRVPFEPTQERLSGFQLLCGAAALILCAAIIISLSRAGWFEVGLGIFVFVYLLPSRRDLGRREVPASSQWKANGRAKERGTTRWLLLAAGGLLTVALVSLLLVGAGGREQAGARAAESISHGVGFWDRVDMWVDSAGIVRDYPVFGSGFDSWSTVFPRYQRPPWTRFFSGAAQNDYVEIASEIGIVGLMLLGWLCWMIGRYLVSGADSIPVRHRALFAALVAAIPIMGFHEALDFCMQIPANAMLFALLVALSVRLVRTHRGATEGRLHGVEARTMSAALALVAVVALLGVFYQRETIYPDDLRYPISIHDNQATILSHPASPIPHLWLADRIHDSTGVWPVPELKAAIWLDPTNPAGRDRYVQALLAEGAMQKALRQIAIATYLAPRLSDHGYLNDREIPWLTEDERAAAERGLSQASASGFEGATEGLAQLYTSEGRQSMAAGVYEAAAQRMPNAAGKFELSLAAATSYARAGEHRKAERLLLAAIDLVSDDPRPYSYLIGMVYGPERNTEAAIKTIRLAARNGLSTAPLYLELEDAAQKAGDAKLAEAALRDAVDADPSFSSWIRLGSFYLERGDFAEAGEPIRRALKIDPRSGQAYFLLAQAEEGEYQYSAAQADYQRAIALAPNNSEYRDRSIDLLRKIADNAGRSLPRSTAGETE
jgi:tetratricopeptide (TPR) repeat protein/O-antigen ligase